MSVINHLETIEDPSSDINKRDNPINIMFLAIDAVLSSADGRKSIQQFGKNQID